MRLYSAELWLFFEQELFKNAFLEAYNGYFLHNRDAPSRCTATNCLIRSKFSFAPNTMIEPTLAILWGWAVFQYI